MLKDGNNVKDRMYNNVKECVIMLKIECIIL